MVLTHTTLVVLALSGLVTHQSFKKAKLRQDVEIGTLLNLRTSTSQKCEAVLRRARIQGSKTCVSLNSGVESNKGEEGRT